MPSAIIDLSIKKWEETTKFEKTIVLFHISNFMNISLSMKYYISTVKVQCIPYSHLIKWYMHWCCWTYVIKTWIILTKSKLIYKYTSKTPPHKHASVFALCTRILRRIAPSGFTLQAQILLVHVSCFVFMEIFEKNVSKPTPNFLRRIEMQKKKKKKKCLPLWSDTRFECCKASVAKFFWKNKCVSIKMLWNA